MACFTILRVSVFRKGGERECDTIPYRSLQVRENHRSETSTTDQPEIMALCPYDRGPPEVCMCMLAHPIRQRVWKSFHPELHRDATLQVLYYRDTGLSINNVQEPHQLHHLIW